MGHTRLGTLPKTRAWKDVVSVYAGADASPPERTDFGHEVARVADSAMQAAAAALKAARGDRGVAHVFFLLTQIALAARRQDPEGALWEIGISLPPDASRLDLSAEVNRALDDHFLGAGGAPSDLAEMAQLALAETLASWFRGRPSDLFASPREQFWGDLRALGTQMAFGGIARQFFGNLIGRLLGFHLSRVVRPGEGQSLIGDAGDLTRFNDELRRHALERALVVRDFAGGWFSKTEFERGIDPSNVRRFVAHALRKVAAEFRRGADRG